MALKALEFRPKMKVNVKTWGKMEMSPSTSLTYCLEEGSRLKLQADKLHVIGIPERCVGGWGEKM